MTKETVQSLRIKLEEHYQHVNKVGNSIEVKTSYFYHHGRTAEKLAAEVQKIVGSDFVVTGEDRWANWPKTSYLVAIVKEK